MTLTSFLNSDTLDLIKFLLWVILTVIASILLVIKLFLKKKHLSTDEIDALLLKLNQVRNNLGIQDGKKLAKQIKLSNQIDADKAQKTLENLKQILEAKVDEKKKGS